LKKPILCNITSFRKSIFKIKKRLEKRIILQEAKKLESHKIIDDENREDMKDISSQSNEGGDKRKSINTKDFENKIFGGKPETYKSPYKLEVETYSSQRRNSFQNKLLEKKDSEKKVKKKKTHLDLLKDIDIEDEEIFEHVCIKSFLNIINKLNYTDEFNEKNQDDVVFELINTIKMSFQKTINIKDEDYSKFWNEVKPKIQTPLETKFEVWMKHIELTLNSENINLEKRYFFTIEKNDKEMFKSEIKMFREAENKACFELNEELRFDISSKDKLVLFIYRSSLLSFKKFGKIKIDVQDYKNVFIYKEVVW
jgi:hypothetical protein